MTYKSGEKPQVGDVVRFMNKQSTDTVVDIPNSLPDKRAIHFRSNNPDSLFQDFVTLPNLFTLVKRKGVATLGIEVR